MADTSPRNVTGRGLGLYAGKTPFGGAKYRNPNSSEAPWLWHGCNNRSFCDGHHSHD